MGLIWEISAHAARQNAWNFGARLFCKNIKKSGFNDIYNIQFFQDTYSQNGFFRKCFSHPTRPPVRPSARHGSQVINLVRFPIFPGSQVIELVRFLVFPISHVTKMIRVPVFPVSHVIKLVPFLVFPSSQVIKVVRVPIFPGSQVIKLVRVSVFTGSQVIKMVRVPVFSDTQSISSDTQSTTV